MTKLNPKTYFDLIKRLPLRPLRSETDLDEAITVSTELYERLCDLSQEEQDYLEVLGTLIGIYEKEHHSRKDSFSPIENVKYLFEANDLRQADFGKLVGLPSGRASEIWNGKRDLSKAHVLALAEHFCVSSDLFLSKEKATDRTKRSAVVALTKPGANQRKKI